MHPDPGKWMAIRGAVEYYARSTHAFSAGIKCRHCTCIGLHTNRGGFYCSFLFDIQISTNMTTLKTYFGYQMLMNLLGI